MTANPLPSWNDGPARRAVVAFVAIATEQGSPTFVPPSARIAVFDNDGTLWCERPLPIQADFLLRKVGDQVAKDPSLRSKQPWKAVWEKDHAWLANAVAKHYQGDDGDLKSMAAGLLEAYVGESIDSYAERAEGFLREHENPILGRPYLKTAYAPMRELLRYLEANGFTNYIVSGGGRDFVRPISSELYGIPPERVIGSTVALEYRVQKGVGDVYHKSELELLDDGPEKVVRIWSRIGARPILAAGNSNGDLEMLEYTAQGKRPSLCLLVKHDDDRRDIAYTAGAEKVLEASRCNGWTTVSVRNDWKTVFIG